MKIEQNQNDKYIFRPFETKNFISANNKSCVNDSELLKNFRLTEIFNYSTKQTTPSTSDISLRNSLFNSLVSYPKIQEEILNSHRKYSDTQPASSLHSMPSKIPPLGGLCKTISQIGQANSTMSSSSSSTLVQSKCNLSDSLKIQQSSTDNSVDSDDCVSEASTSKDESQKMWPAWVSLIFTYCSACSL